MKTLLLLLISQALLTSAQAQTAPPSQFRLSEKFRLPPRKSGRVLAPATSAEQQLAPGSTYQSRPHTLRIAVPNTEGNAMPQAAAPATEAPGGVRQLPLQQYQPEVPAGKPESNSTSQDKHSSGKP